MKKHLLFLFSLLFASEFLIAQINIVSYPLEEKLYLNDQAFFFKENGHSLDIHQILNSSFEEKFTPLQGKMHFGLSPDAHWFKFSLKHTSPQPRNYFLEIDYFGVDELSFYEIKNDSLVSEQKLGDKLPFVERKEKYRNPLASLSLSDTLIHTYYLRAVSTGHLFVPLDLYTSSEFVSKDNMLTLELGVGLGLLLLVAFYALMLFVSTREKKYLYYCLFILSSTGFIALRTGIGAMYIWPMISVWSSRPRFISIYIMLLFSTLFTNSFFDIKKYKPRWSNLLKIEAAIYVCILLAIVVDSERPFQGWLSIMVFFHNMLMVITGIIAWKRGDQSARLYTIGMFLFVAVSMLYVLGFTLLPTFFSNIRFLSYGYYMEIIFLTIAVSKNYQQMLKELVMAKVDEENKSKETNQLLGTIDQKQKELATLSMKIQNKNKTLEDLKIRFEKTENNDSKKEFLKFKNLINDNLNLDEDWETFKLHFESVHDHFFEQLQPYTLSVNELKLCAYIRINLSTKEIARMLLVKPTSVQVARHRLKKKLKLTEQDDLIDFLRKL